MEYEIINRYGTRLSRRKLAVTFADGTVICYTNAKATYLEVLRKFDPAVLATVGLEIGHKPIFSVEKYADMANYMEELRDGWYVNTRSDTSAKYLQLSHLNKTLGLDLKIEMTDSCEGMTKCSREAKARKEQIVFSVNGVKGEVNGGAKGLFCSVMERIDTEMLHRKSFEVFGKELVTTFRKYPSQVQIGNGLWVTVPRSMKEVLKVFSSLNDRFGCGIGLIYLGDREEDLKRVG